MKFSLIASCKTPYGSARAGKICTAHSEILTPIFMPVGTAAVVKSLDAAGMDELGARIILANTYHCYLRPGAHRIAALGGLHGFSGYGGSFLTDSGGFQAFSLRSRTRESDDGVAFKSHIDGSLHFFSPERVLMMQYLFNSDIAMVLDDLPALPATSERIEISLRKTVAWARRSLEFAAGWADAKPAELVRRYALELYGDESIATAACENAPKNRENNVFAIIQGGTDQNARRRCLEEILGCEGRAEFAGLAIGGLSVGEPNEAMYETVAALTPLMPAQRPRYLMGVGTPRDLLENIARGVDMFDCVMPTRNARNGTIFTSAGRLAIKNARFALDSAPLDERCGCATCRRYSRAYLHHLFRAGELSFFRLASVHNLHFYLQLVAAAREAIIAGNYAAWMREQLTAWGEI